MKIFKKIENMIKTCLLPQKMFYENVSYYTDNSKLELNDQERKTTQIPINIINNQKNLNKRTSSEMNNYYFFDSNSINNIYDNDEIDYDSIKKQIITEDVLVLKEEVFNEYLDALFCVLLDWICDREINIQDGTQTDVDIVIRNINGLEMLSALNSELKNSEFTQKFLNIINYVIMTKGNAFFI